MSTRLLGERGRLRAWRRIVHPVSSEMQDVSRISDLVRCKAMERFRPLAQKLMGKAIFENKPEVAHLSYNEEPIAAEEE